jgi:hypothetical protein
MTSNSGAGVTLVGRAGESVRLALLMVVDRACARRGAPHGGRSYAESVAEVNESLVRLPDEGDKGVVIDGLDRVMIETGLAGAETIVLLTVAGNRDDHRIRESFLSKTARDLIPVHARQANVEQYEFRPESKCFGDRGGAVMGGADVVS